MILDWFKFSLLFLYILLVLVLVCSVAFSSNVRKFLAKIHKSPTDTHSWLRYACTFILIVALGIAIYQATYSDINVTAISLLVGIAITGKVTASGISKTK